MNKQKLIRCMTCIVLILFILSSCDSGIKKFTKTVTIENTVLTYYYRIIDFPDISTSISIRYQDGNKELVKTGMDGEPDFSEEMKTVVYDENHHIYSSYDLLFYYRDDKLRYISAGHEWSETFEKYPREKQAELLDIYKAVMFSYDILYWYSFAEVMVSQNDPETLEVLNELADGNTKRFADLQKDFSSQREAVNWAKEILEKYSD